MSYVIIQVLEIIVAVLLMLAILLQNRGTGLGSVFGGSSNVYRTKRGVEKFLLYATVVLVLMLFGLLIAGLFFYRAG